MAKSYLLSIAIAAFLINIATNVLCSDDEDEYYSDEDEYYYDDDEYYEDYEYEDDEDENTDDYKDDSPSSKLKKPANTGETCVSNTKSTESSCHSTETPEPPECSTSRPECEDGSPSSPNPDEPSSFCVFDLLDGKQLFNYETMSNETFSDKQKTRDERGLPRLLRFNFERDTCLNMNNRRGVYGWLKDICAED